MADEGAEPIKLSEASVEQVAGHLTELVAPRSLSQNLVGSSSHTTEEEGGSQQGEKHVNLVFSTGHMEKQETEMKWKLEMETGNGNWKWKLEMKMGTKSLVQCFLHGLVSSVLTRILLSNSDMTSFASP